MPQMLSPNAWFWQNVWSQLMGQNIPAAADPSGGTAPGSLTGADQGGGTVQYTTPIAPWFGASGQTYYDPNLLPGTRTAQDLISLPGVDLPPPGYGGQQDTSIIPSSSENVPPIGSGFSNLIQAPDPSATPTGGDAFSQLLQQYVTDPSGFLAGSGTGGPQPVSTGYLPDGQGGYTLNPVWSNLPSGGLSMGQDVQIQTAPSEIGGIDIPQADMAPQQTTAPDPTTGAPYDPSTNPMMWAPNPANYDPSTDPTQTSNVPTAPGATPDVLPASPVDPTGSGITWSADPNQIYGPTTAPNLWNQPTDWSNLGNQVSNVVSTAGGAISNTATTLGNFLGNIFTGTDPTPNIAPSGSPVGSTTPDAVASGIPLAGATFNLGATGGDLGSAGAQLALFHGVWGGKAPMDYNTWNAGAGTPEGWAARPGGNYQNYLNIWNALRRQQASAPPQTRTPGQPQDAGSGQGQGVTGRMASTAAR